MSVILCSFGDSKFEKSLQLQSRRAYSLGFERVFHYGPTSLSKEFRLRNSETLNFERGSGYWVWKPEIILQTMLRCRPSDVILYLDAGAIPVTDASKFQELMHDSKIHVWESGGEFPSNSSWIDKGVSIDLDLTSEMLLSNHCWAGAICIVNNYQNFEIIKNWQVLCENPNYLRPDSYSNYEPGDGFIWHRHDQSLLNVIIQRQNESFSVHRSNSLDYLYSNSRKLILIHRQGKLKSMTELRLLLYLKYIKRVVSSLLPSDLRNKFNVFLTPRGRRRNISKVEMWRHRKNN